MRRLTLAELNGRAGDAEHIFGSFQMSHFRARVLLLAIAIASLGPNASHADPTNGERLARQWCANCHVINGSGPSATLPQGPPSFRVVAGHLNPEQLRAFLTHPHGQMPDLSLTRSDMEIFVVAAAIGQPVDQRRVAVMGKDNRLVGGEQRVEIMIAEPVRVVFARL